MAAAWLPVTTPELPPDEMESLGPMLRELLGHATPALADGRYLHWDQLRGLQPPDGLTPGQFWASVKWSRGRAAIPIEAMVRTFGLPFGYVPLPTIQRVLHAFDRATPGLGPLAGLAAEAPAAEYLSRQLIEEAIGSSALSAAQPVPRESARQLLREQRAPSSREERALANHYRALQRLLAIRAEARPLTFADVLGLHAILGEGVLEDAGGEGQLRAAEDAPHADAERARLPPPPPAAGLGDRIDALLRFIEARPGEGAFLHPVLRAIAVHYWLIHERPFRDGNARMARLLFFWSALRHAHDVVGFLSLSGALARDPSAYALAVAHTATDRGDLTYFFLNQLAALEAALQKLAARLQRSAARSSVLARALPGFDALHHRQRALLQQAIAHPTHSYTIEGHAAAHGVHYQTARGDFVDLVAAGYFENRRAGKGKRLYLVERLAKLGDEIRTA